jgi:hypothetical protein
MMALLAILISLAALIVAAAALLLALADGAPRHGDDGPEACDPRSDLWP